MCAAVTPYSPSWSQILTHVKITQSRKPICPLNLDPYNPLKNRKRTLKTLNPNQLNPSHSNQLIFLKLISPNRLYSSTPDQKFPHWYLPFSALNPPFLSLVTLSRNCVPQKLSFFNRVTHYTYEFPKASLWHACPSQVYPFLPLSFLFNSFSLFSIYPSLNSVQYWCRPMFESWNQLLGGVVQSHVGTHALDLIYSFLKINKMDHLFYLLIKHNRQKWTKPSLTHPATKAMPHGTPELPNNFPSGYYVWTMFGMCSVIGYA